MAFLSALVAGVVAGVLTVAQHVAGVFSAVGWTLLNRPLVVLAIVAVVGLGNVAARLLDRLPR